VLIVSSANHEIFPGAIKSNTSATCREPKCILQNTGHFALEHKGRKIAFRTQNFLIGLWRLAE
jgi:hypothetical protein